MVISGRTRWLRALLVAPLLVFVLAASSHLAFRCGISGMSMLECCCPAEVDTGTPAPSPQASLSESGCCQHLIVATDKLPVVGSEVLPERPRLFVGWLVPPSGDTGDATARDPYEQSASTVPLGRAAPRYLLTHALLI